MVNLGWCTSTKERRFLGGCTQGTGETNPCSLVSRSVTSACRAVASAIVHCAIGSGALADVRYQRRSTSNAQRSTICWGCAFGLNRRIGVRRSLGKQRPKGNPKSQASLRLRSGPEPVERQIPSKLQIQNPLSLCYLCLPRRSLGVGGFPPVKTPVSLLLVR